MERLGVVVCMMLNSILCFGQNVKWEELSGSTFIRAEKEHKIILVNLEANWCHWCHVMHDSTYTNTNVVQYLNEHFITIKADQDATPALAERYKEYGWPATIFLNSEGHDIVKRAGYIEPNLFLKLLKAIVADPSPEMYNKRLSDIGNEDSPNVAKMIQTQIALNTKVLDLEIGGFDQGQKYVAFNPFEYGLFFSKNKDLHQWINRSISGAGNLVDKEWGGVYQYSTHYDWEHLHFEKLLKIQARYIMMFLWSSQYWGDRNSMSKVLKTTQYLDQFLLNSNGLYFNAQDADLVQGEHSEAYFELSSQERLKLGIPRIDSNTYTYNNAHLALAFMKLYANTSNLNYLNKAKKILKELSDRKTTNGLYEHSAQKDQVYSLKDQTYLAMAWIELNKLESSDEIIANLSELLVEVDQQFKLKNGSFQSFVGDIGLQPEPIVDENIAIARVLNMASYICDKEYFKRSAEGIFEFLITPAVADTYYSEVGLVMLHEELEKEPSQYVYVYNGSVQPFHLRVNAMAPFYSTIKKYDEGQLPENKKGMFSGFEKDVLFMCTDNYCSAPMYNSNDVSAFFKKDLGID